MFTTPKTVLNVISSLEINTDRESFSSPKWRIISAVSNVVFTFNYSYNFYFYCCANKEIQSAARSLLSDWRETLTSFCRRKADLLNVIIL